MFDTMVAASAWRLLSLPHCCETSCRFSACPLRKRGFLALLWSVLKSHMEEKPQEATGENFFPVPLLMEFPNCHPDPPHPLSSAG